MKRSWMIFWLLRSMASVGPGTGWMSGGMQIGLAVGMYRMSGTVHHRYGGGEIGSSIRLTKILGMTK